jgi:hypothetical protein
VQDGIRLGVMGAMTALSLATTPTGFARRTVTFGPITEVAVLFAGIFATMIPALEILRVRGAELGVRRPGSSSGFRGAVVVPRQRADLSHLRIARANLGPEATSPSISRADRSRRRS